LSLGRVLGLQNSHHFLDRFLDILRVWVALNLVDKVLRKLRVFAHDFLELRQLQDLLDHRVDRPLGFLLRLLKLKPQLVLLKQLKAH
jgi:hypothetical protein